MTDITSSSSKIGVLLIHGLTGTPTEMRPLHKYLKHLGYKVECPILPGHGKGHEELLVTKWQDWLDGVRQTLNDLTKECDEVIVIGLSVGGLLGVLLAAENKKVSGLVLLSFALGIPGPNMPRRRCLLPLVFKFPFLRKYLFWKEEPPYGLKDKRLQQNITRTIEASKRGETTRYGLFRTYVESLYQHKLLQEEIWKKASFVTCPTFIMHSLEDTMLSIDNATAIYNLISSKKKSLEFITGCDHVMTVDLRKDEVAKRAGIFISQVFNLSPPKDFPTRVSEETKLTCEIHPYLNSLSSNEFNELFSSNHVKNQNNNDFNFHSIVIRDENKPVLFLPIFETKEKIVIAKWISGSLNSKVLGVGFLNGASNHIGLNKDASKETIDVAWSMAFQALNSLAIGTNSDTICFTSDKTLPTEKLSEFINANQIQLPINNTNVLLKHKNQVVHWLLSNFGNNLNETLVETFQNQSAA